MSNNDIESMKRIDTELAEIAQAGIIMGQRVASPIEIADLNVHRYKLRIEKARIVDRNTVPSCT